MKYQEAHTMYNDLMALVASNEAFYFTDFSRGDTKFRVFNYRLASYTEFQPEMFENNTAPVAWEARGIMFEIDCDDIDIRIAARPMEKFWNLNENPFTMDLDLDTISGFEEKVDGSLISTYIYYDRGIKKLGLKTKGSLTSEQAIAAGNWLADNKKFENELFVLSGGAGLRSNTINLEWCAPDNRVVIGYMEPKLMVLNMRDNYTGEYINFELLDNTVYAETYSHWIGVHEVDNKVEFAQQISQMEGTEGYVIVFNSGMRVKVKTEWYLVQHRAKDSINSPRRLFEAVIEEATDDLRSLVYDDPLALKLINEMEQKVGHLYNHTVATVEKFYDDNKKLERKEYAILGQKELDRPHFGLAMSKYIGKDVDYKAWLRKNYKLFGIKDEPEKTAEEK